MQAAVERVLEGGMRLMNAKGAAAVLMDVHTGEVVSLASLPDFDPNDRPRPLTEGDQAESPLFNRAVQGLYELGSTFKIFTAAQGIDATPGQPLHLDRHERSAEMGHAPHPRFPPNHGPALTVEDVIVKSSNIGTARMSR